VDEAHLKPESEEEGDSEAIGTSFVSESDREESQEERPEAIGTSFISESNRGEIGPTLRISDLKKLSLAKRSVTAGEVIDQQWTRTKRFRKRLIPRELKSSQTQKRQLKTCDRSN
jgi:hypothetical protein